MILQFSAHICLKFYEDSSSLGAVVKPLLIKRSSGRPKTIRMKSTTTDGKRRPMKYGRCDVVRRHNKITYRAPI